jgi:hypothetical protein
MADRMAESPTFITLGPEGTCHENALRRYLEFQGLPGANVEFVSDFLDGLERVRVQPNSFLVQCSSHTLVNVVTERYPQEVYVVDTFLYPAKEMGLLVRRDVEEPRTLGIVDAASGYVDLGRWEQVTEETANPVVFGGLLAGKYDAGVTIVSFAEEHPDVVRVVERFGEVDTTWLVYGRRRRYNGQLIGHRIAWLYNGEPRPGVGLQPALVD